MNMQSGRSKLVLVALVFWGAVALCAAMFTTRTVDGTRMVYTIEESDLTDSEIVEATERRVRCFFDSTYDVSLSDDGTRLQIDLATSDSQVIKSIDQVLHHEGHLRFLVMADSKPGGPVALAAKAQAENGDFSRDVKNDAGESIGRWVYIDRGTDPITGRRELRVAPERMTTRNSQTGELVDLSVELQSVEGDRKVDQWMADNDVSDLDALAISESENDLDGDAVNFASLTLDQNGDHAIDLEFTDVGSAMLADLTTRYSPVGKNYYQLGMVIDDRLISAPNILQRIERRARITGVFDESEVRTLVTLLKAGRLPVTLSDQPISQESIEISVPLLTWPF